MRSSALSILRLPLLRTWFPSLGLHKTPFQALIPFLQCNSVGKSFNSTRTPLYFSISRLVYRWIPLFVLSLSLTRTGLSVLTTIDKFGIFNNMTKEIHHNQTILSCMTYIQLHILQHLSLLCIELWNIPNLAPDSTMYALQSLLTPVALSFKEETTSNFVHCLSVSDHNLGAFLDRGLTPFPSQPGSFLNPLQAMVQSNKDRNFQDPACKQNPTLPRSDALFRLVVPWP
jgi:hypothetical protein